MRGQQVDLQGEPIRDENVCTFSPDRVYRYYLVHVWNEHKPPMAWVMLNPSTADEQELDPTLRRCKGFAQDLGFGAIEIYNLFALRSPTPGVLDVHHDPVGPRNDEFLERVFEERAESHGGWTHAEEPYVMVAWGTKGELHDRWRRVAGLADEAGCELRCLRTTKDGHPQHPLYLPADLQPQPWNPDEVTP